MKCQTVISISSEPIEYYYISITCHCDKQIYIKCIIVWNALDSQYDIVPAQNK